MMSVSHGKTIVGRVSTISKYLVPITTALNVTKTCMLDSMSSHAENVNASTEVIKIIRYPWGNEYYSYTQRDASTQTQLRSLL